MHYPNSTDDWPTDFFYGACANCLPGAATSCSLSELRPLRVCHEANKFLLGTIYRPPSAATYTPSRHQSVAPRATSRRPSSSGSVSGSRFERGGVVLPGGFDYNNADDLFAAGRVLDEVRGQIFERERRARGGGTLSPVGQEYVIGSLDEEAVEGGDDEEEEDGEPVSRSRRSKGKRPAR